jgi:putative salt-induced outer membrane protein YdiY
MVRKTSFFFVGGFTVALLLICSGQLLADEILLENGDRLTGTVLNLEGGKLTLKTDYAGEIQIPVEKIKKLTTENPVEVHLGTGEVIKGKVKTVEEGKLEVEPSPDRTAATIELNKVASINPPPVKWHGSLNLGGSSQTGNTTRDSASVAAAAMRRTEDDRFSLEFLYNYASDNGTTSARNTYGGLKYDYFFTKKFYGYLATDFLNDSFQDLQLRTTVGPGVGYEIWDDPIKALGLEGGFAYVWEQHTSNPNQDYATARLAANFRYQIFKFLAFTDYLQVYPNLNYGGHYTSRNEAALISPLGSGWALRLSNIWQRNSDPAPGLVDDDLTTILSLQYSF